MSFTLIEKIEAFKEACETGDTCVLDHMLYQKEFDVNECLPAFDKQIKIYGFNQMRDRVRLPPWVIAVHYSSAPVLKWLLRNGADIIVFHYVTYLPVAMSRRNPDLINLLLGVGHEKDFTTDDEYVASFEGVFAGLIRPRAIDEVRNRDAQRCVDTLKVILDYYSMKVGDRGNEKIKKFKKIFITLKAIVENDLNKLSEIIDKKHFAIIDKYDLAMLSININKREVTRLFIEKGVKQEEIFLNRLSSGDKELAQVCLDNGVDPQKTSILTTICKWKNKDALDFLTERYFLQPEPNFLRQLYPSFEASDAEFFKIILLEIPNIDINETDQDGNTILSPNLPCEIYATLLKLGINPRLRGPRFGPAFHHCREDSKANCSVIKYLEKLSRVRPNNARLLLPYVLRLGDYWNSRLSKNNFESEPDRKSELEQLKKIQISPKFMDQPSRTLFDFIFVFNPDKTARFARNSIIHELRQDCSGDFENKFRNYGCLINYKLRRGRRRRNLMDSARETLKSAMGTELPEELTNMIFQHLTDEKIEKMSQSSSSSQLNIIPLRQVRIHLHDIMKYPNFVGRF